MGTIFQQQTAVAQWRTLIVEAAARCDTSLDDDMESYLVFLLMRFVNRPEMAASVLALDYLHGMQQTGSRQEAQLRDVGDQCLLYSGLFPLRARRRLVRIRYYVDLGRSAYQHLSTQVQRGWSDTFVRLAHGFVPLMEVLQAARVQHDPLDNDALALHELRDECGSRRAGALLWARFGGTLADGGGARRRH